MSAFYEIKQAIDQHPDRDNIIRGLKAWIGTTGIVISDISKYEKPVKPVETEEQT